MKLIQVQTSTEKHVTDREKPAEVNNDRFLQQKRKTHWKY